MLDFATLQDLKTAIRNASAMLRHDRHRCSARVRNSDSAGLVPSGVFYDTKLSRNFVTFRNIMKYKAERRGR